MKMTEKERKEARYLRELVPALSKFKPRAWIQISSIANDVEEFIATLQMLYREGNFTDESGYCIIEVKNESLVRLSPNYLESKSTNFSIWKK